MDVNRGILLMAQEIIKDALDIEKFKELNYASSCEDCSHFNDTNETCTFGFPTAPHLKRNQLHDLETKGVIAFCRMMEID
jgi:hypothetical protein